MSKKTETKPANKPPAKKPIDHSIDPQPAPTEGGRYVVNNGELIKQNEG